MQDCCRSPQGERGLKLICGHTSKRITGSLPARGAWIEIAWSENCHDDAQSLPARGAWIEIEDSLHDERRSCVAPRKGSVD